jgi:hypothetical protein
MILLTVQLCTQALILPEGSTKQKLGGASAIELNMGMQE